MTTLCLSAILAIAMSASASEPAFLRSVDGDDLKAALCYAGTGTRCLSSAQAAKLAAAVDELMLVRSGNDQTLADFIDVIQAMRVTATYRTMRVFPGRRTLRDVCRELGELAVRQQRLEREGRKDELSGTLYRICAARKSGASDAEVQCIVRSALDRGDLMVRSGTELRQVSLRLDLLAHQLVAGVQVVASQARFRGVAPVEYLSEFSGHRVRDHSVSLK